MAPDIGERERANRRALKRHTLMLNRRAVTLRTIIPQSSRQWPTVWGRAIQWILPWTQEGYPGVRAGVEELLAGRAGWQAFKLWRAGSRSAPEWLASQLADMIESRCRAGLEIVQELRDYRVPIRRQGGAMAVHADGRDRRGGRIGRRNPSALDIAKGAATHQPDSEMSLIRTAEKTSPHLGCDPHSRAASVDQASNVQPSDTPSDFD